MCADLLECPRKRLDIGIRQVTRRVLLDRKTMVPARCLQGPAALVCENDQARPPTERKRFWPDVGRRSLHEGVTHPGIRGKPLPMANRTELPVAFAADESVVINFGILSGREATQAELDRLAQVLRLAGAGADMTITAERRQD